MTAIRLRRAAAALALAAATACGSDNGTDPAVAAVAGRYTLRTIDGQPLPYAINTNWVLGATLTLTDDSRVIVQGRLLPVGEPGGPAPPPTFETGVSETGTFAVSGNELTFDTGHVGGLIFLDLAFGVVNDASTVTVVAIPGTRHTFVYKREGS